MAPKKRATRKKPAGKDKVKASAGPATKPAGVRKPATTGAAARKAAGSGPKRRLPARKAAGRRTPSEEEDEEASDGGLREGEAADPPPTPPPADERQDEVHGEGEAAGSPPPADERPDEVEEELPAEEILEKEREEALASTQGDLTCTLNGEDATLTLILQVRKDEDGYESRLGYHARLTINQRIKGESTQESAGYITAWRISKAVAAHLRAEAQMWRRELLTDIRKIPPPLKETALCLKALYDTKGTPAANNVTDATIRQRLVDNSLIFINMIYIRPKFQRQRLLQHILSLYHDLLEQLPEWYAFSGTLVLVPSKPAGVKGNVWGERELKDIEQRLQRAYERSGGYAVYTEDAKVGNRYVTVLGRTLP